MSRSGAKATGSETPLAPTERGRRITWHWSADVECVIGIDKQMGQGYVLFPRSTRTHTDFEKRPRLEAPKRAFGDQEARDGFHVIYLLYIQR